jgi:transcriptional regulator with XRE-family HTH domain
MGNLPETARINEAMGAFLRARREAAGLSAEKLADQVGMTRQAFHLLETGRNGMRLSTLYLIATVLGMTLAELVDGFAVSPHRGKQGRK